MMPVDGEPANDRWTVPVDTCHTGDCRSSTIIGRNEKIHGRKCNSRRKRPAKYFRRELGGRVDAARGCDDGADDKFTRRIVHEINECRRGRNIEKRFLFRRIHDAFRSWSSAAANRGQRSKKENLVRAHFTDGYEDFFRRRIDMNHVLLGELPGGHPLVEFGHGSRNRFRFRGKRERDNENEQSDCCDDRAARSRSNSQKT
jgi:hypothetical protein